MDGLESAVARVCAGVGARWEPRGRCQMCLPHRGSEDCLGEGVGVRLGCRRFGHIIFENGNILQKTNEHWKREHRVVFVINISIA